MSATHAQRPARRRARPGARGPSRGTSRGAAAHDLLDADHPLVRADARVHALGAQSTAVAILGVLVGLAWLAAPDGGYALPLLATVVVQTVLAVGLVLALQAKRDAAVHLIADGRGSLPLVSVARARRRLLQPMRRERLARSLDALRREVARPLRGQLPLYSRGVVASVDAELARVARLLRAPHAPADGVALALLLLTSDSSALYGEDPERLGQELGRVTFTLARTERHERDTVVMPIDVKRRRWCA